MYIENLVRVMNTSQINALIFSEMGAEDKLKAIASMSDADTREIQNVTILRILKECSNKYGSFYIESERRKGNNWDSVVKGLELVNGRPFVNVYVQNTKTDTNVFVHFSEFTKDETFYGRSDVGSYQYTAREKADVVRSILSEYVYWEYIEKDEREKRQKVAKLTHWTIVNVVYNEFYEKWRCGNYGREKELARYHRCVKAVQAYAEEHADELFGKSEEELQAVYREVFVSAE